MDRKATQGRFAWRHLSKDGTSVVWYFTQELGTETDYDARRDGRRWRCYCGTGQTRLPLIGINCLREAGATLPITRTQT